ncbi:uncharacterized protein LOC132755332 [Ruditapes philippinarum]|uniref:uncharacterized protein LOC132755332 n=1 Tax=Ruditapes philippinarum TaxID=129788 RepID=UPI00295B157F|nr:uncharacterized protein LOC132755332 [Ruditapes philippinarum]
MADLNTMQTTDTETEEKRVKRLTEKSEKLYEENVEKYRKKLMSYRREIEEIILLYKNTEELTKNDSVEMRNKLNNYYDNYDMIVQEYHNYLERKGTEQSLKELASEKVIHRTTAEKVVMILTEIEMSIKNVSVHIPSIVPSRTSTKSSSVKSQKSNILIAEQKAKLEAAKTKLEYEKKESALKEKMASLDSKLSLLNNEKEVAIELTKLETLEEHLSENSHSEASVKSEIFGKTNHCRLSDVSGLPRRINLMTPKPAIPLREPMFDEISHLNPNAKPFAPQLSDLSVFLLKKDLMIQRLNTYNDKPEQFQLWKANFKNIMNELNASPIEELDLLLRYLGPRSKEQAQNIAQSNPNNKSKALQLIWERLFERFGAPELIEKSLKQRIDSFPRIKDNSELYGLADLCREIESTKNDERYTHLLSYFESSTGVRPILEKLPFHIQNKWMYRATNYKRANQVLYPPFSVFCTFLDEISTMFNDPGLSVSYVKSNERKPSQNQTFSVRSQNQTVNVRKTVTDASHVQCVEFMPNCCPVHNNAKSHTLNNCMTFLQRSVSERKRFLRDNNICFKCCNSNKHTFKSCTFTGPCDECGSQRHPAALHYFQAEQSTTGSDRQGKQPSKDYGRERPAVTPPVKPTFETKPLPQDQRPPSIVTGRCTNICGDGFVGKSCSKTLLVNIYPNNHPELSRSVYCIVDDQSNRTLCKSKMFDLFSNVPVGNENYELNSCSGSSACNGRTIDNMTVSSIDGQFCTKLPPILECDSIPDSRLEIPTPDIVKYHQHLSDVPIPRLREDCEIVLLIVRDVAEVHHVFEQRISPEKPGAPFAQRLGLGWVVIGEVCLSSHRPPVRTMKTYVCESGRPSIFEPCSNKITVKHCHLDQVGANDIFVHTKNDDKPGLSLEDKEFLKLMDTQFHRDNSGHWTAPLPFRTPRIKLPNNRSEAYRRAKTFESSLKTRST